MKVLNKGDIKTGRGIFMVPENQKDVHIINALKNNKKTPQSSSIKVEPLGKDEFLITEYRKDKHTGVVLTYKRITSLAQVNLVFDIIKELTENGKRATNYREIVDELTDRLSLRMSPTLFFGSRNKYFEHYYYPIRVIEYKGIIKYGGRGTTELLNKRIRKIKQ